MVTKTIAVKARPIFFGVDAGVICAENAADHAIPPATQRFMAKRAGATIVKVRASHVPMNSRPQAVTDLILDADRPAIDRGDGVFLCGDQVAAPGCLSEVSFASAIDASTLAVEHARRGGLRRVA
jgi:hypothetical protein